MRDHHQRPHIVLNDEGAIVSVFWAPPFEGPLCASPSDVESYYAAYHIFSTIVDDVDLGIKKVSATSARRPHITHTGYLRLLSVVFLSPVLASHDVSLLTGTRTTSHFEFRTACSPACSFSFFLFLFFLLIDRSIDIIHGTRLVRDEQGWRVELRLEPGEVAVFNQRKIMHGRGAFQTDAMRTTTTTASAARGEKVDADADVVEGDHSGDGGVRHFQGCYVNIDDFLNRYRVLKRRMDEPSTELEQPGRGGDICADVHIGNSSL